MIKRYLILILYFSVAIFAQDEDKDNPNVELPDFVITGRDVVEIESKDKIKPEFISTLSEEFIKPRFSSEQLETREVSNPIKSDINLFDSTYFLNGVFNSSAGYYELPKADINLMHRFNNGLFKGFASGYNRRAYVDNSEKYNINGGVNFSYFINTESSFLPGTQLGLNGDLGLTSYKLFASPDPTQKRDLLTGNGEIKISNTVSDKYLFFINASDQYTSLSDEGFNENIFNINGYTNFNFQTFNIGLKANYKMQYITNEKSNILINNSDQFNYLYLRPAIGLNISNSLKAIFGASYSKGLGETFISPYGSLALKLDKSLSLFTEYAPTAKFHGTGYYLKKNNYLNTTNFVNTVTEYSGDLTFAVKYEYEEYFQIDGGFKYSSSSNLPYFTSSGTQGAFNINFADARNFSGFVDLLFYTGPYGMFFSSFKFNDVRDTSNNFVPYHPSIDVNLSYSYNFNIGLKAEAGLTYYSKSYDDILNTRIVDQYIDLGLKFAYRLNPNFYITLELNNLIDNDNFFWYGYKEMPIDALGGLRLEW